MSKKDVFIKDEGDFVTVIFESELSQKALDKQPQGVKDQFHTGTGLNGEKVSKLDISKESLLNIQAWLVSHNLSWDSDV
jgi:hypothetical protein